MLSPYSAFEFFLLTLNLLLNEVRQGKYNEIYLRFRFCIYFIFSESIKLIKYEKLDSDTAFFLLTVGIWQVTKKKKQIF